MVRGEGKCTGDTGCPCCGKTEAGGMMVGIARSSERAATLRGLGEVLTALKVRLQTTVGYLTRELDEPPE